MASPALHEVFKVLICRPLLPFDFYRRFSGHRLNSILPSAENRIRFIFLNLKHSSCQI